jgi:hypothetical protein
MPKHSENEIAEIKRQFSEGLDDHKSAAELKDTFFPYISQIIPSGMPTARYIRSAMLTYYGLESIKFAASLQGKKTIRILSIGCGAAPDFIPFEAYFKKHLKADIEYVGIDINDEIIKTNNLTFQNFPSAKFYAQDARYIDAVKPNSMDVIIFQHPNLLEGRFTNIWETVFKETLPKMIADNGHVYISCYLPEEFLKIKSLTVGNTNKFIKRHPGNEINNSQEPLSEIRILPGSNYMIRTEAMIYCSKKPIRLSEFNLSKPTKSEAPEKDKSGCCARLLKFFAAYFPQATTKTPVNEQKKTL